ncbi:hypothetical protein [Mariprofundus ferrooxydans]|uniref:hypothetical protein n=1 Tax=Mariprofundus ferrooxydans TaxID=314344 RepID=UPI0003667473|nr:hypothetical protein [Mariprofundus ferrooxydans]
MKVNGFATVMAGSLACSVEDADWHFSIRRTDGKTHDPFFEFHGKPVSASDVKVFLPNWDNLEWTEIKDSLLGKSESYAKDSEFKVNVQSTQDGNISHKDVIDAFLDFMRNA